MKTMINEQNLKQNILKMLEREPMSGTAIAECLKESYWKTCYLLEQLQDEGKIELTPRTKYHKIWSLKR